MGHKSRISAPGWSVPAGSKNDVGPGVVAAVRRMQRRAFEIDAMLGDVERVEMAPPALERLEDILAPTLILLGGHDRETNKDAAERLSSLEHPERFTELLAGWLSAHTDPDQP